MKQILLFVVLMAGVALSAPVNARALEPTPEIPSEVEVVKPGQVDSIATKDNDGKARSSPIAETLKKTVPTDEEQPGYKGGLFNWLRGWLHVIDQHGEEADKGISGFLFAAPNAPDDLISTLTTIGGNEGLDGLLQNLLFILVILIAGIALELLFRKITARITSQLANVDQNSELGLGRIWGAMLHILPSLVHITAFTFASLGIFIFTHTGQIQPVRALFMAILVAIVLARSIVLVSTFLFSPGITGFRLLPMDDLPAATVHRSISIPAWYIAFGMMFITLLADLGAAQATLQFVGVVLGTVLIVLIIIIILVRKETVRASILSVDEGEEVSWLRRQFASSWHIPAMLYLFGIWLIWINTMLSGAERDNGALLISLMIVPLYLLLDQFAQWLVGAIVTTLNIFQPSSNKTNGDDEQTFAEIREKQARLKKYMLKGLRIFIGMVLVIWLMSLWGYTVPFAAHLVRAFFDILVTLTLALIFWRIASGFIEKKLTESYQEEEDEKTDEVDEFGSAKQRGRDYTILPMLRKFIASTLVVMVTLIILSSIGVNIGPLLAGAGVVGLALGFGAQKLVSDILSGIFYLLDDAFRVGEYIQAGSLKGTVETITLRNVMLRHHRGMLQIVPHSELGSITNFMRGGIVVKFNLEFPYDTDVNAVRKIIKKVGQEMLDDPELGPDFIKPLKSQGVREIANSVMVIRAKFTAQPGKHFMIQREGYRRISEALAAKGIHYAHRKVIVEVPNLEEKKDRPKSDQVKQIIEAGAAAGQIVSDSGQQEERNKKESPV
ncbi:MAG: mechanosensitive ion channel [Bacteroidales bacterium]